MVQVDSVENVCVQVSKNSVKNLKVSPCQFLVKSAGIGNYFSIKSSLVQQLF